MRLQDKVAIVTGAATGVGLAIARKLARDGARVVIAFLASPDAGFITGQILAVGGGSVYH